MIIIIRALSQVRKGRWRLWFPHKSGWDSGLKKRKAIKKRKGPNKKIIKTERKREKGQCYYPFTTLVLQSSTMIFMIESLLWYQFHILVGIFHYRTWLVYSNDGLPQNALGIHEQASWMHTHLVSFVELSVGTPILSHTDLAGNTSYHFAASRTVFPRVPPYLARDRLRLLAHVYDSVASIHMTENLSRHD